MAITYYDLPLIISQVERLLFCLEAFILQLRLGMLPFVQHDD